MFDGAGVFAWHRRATLDEMDEALLCKKKNYTA